MVMSLPLSVEAYATEVTLKGEDQKKVEYLIKSPSSSKYSIKKATYLLCVKDFDKGDERDNQFHLEAFLA